MPLDTFFLLRPCRSPRCPGQNHQINRTRQNQKPRRSSSLGESPVPRRRPAVRRRPAAWTGPTAASCCPARRTRVTRCRPGTSQYSEYLACGPVTCRGALLLMTVNPTAARRGCRRLRRQWPDGDLLVDSRQRHSQDSWRPRPVTRTRASSALNPTQSSPPIDWPWRGCGTLASSRRPSSLRPNVLPRSGAAPARRPSAPRAVLTMQQTPPCRRLLMLINAQRQSAD
mmetsp:Transcript_10724/g.31612  ORF Transcript_10724/g.31612 Transcript_10724/m.31612 type:complete len:227 (-) Transcript_10724:583-1263(-)